MSVVCNSAILQSGCMLDVTRGGRIDIPAADCECDSSDMPAELPW